MKLIKSIDFPTNLLFFDTETRPKKCPDNKDAELHYFWFGHVLAYRREGSNRTRIKEQTIRNIDSFWSLLLSRCDSKRPLWVFAHNIIFDLTVLDSWSKGDEYGIEVDLPVLDDPPVFICCSSERGKINFVDTFNYWKCSLADLGKQQGLTKKEMPKCKCLCKDWIDYCKRDVDVLATAVDNLVDWLYNNDLGSLKMTIASTAMSTYKHRFLAKDTIHVHDNDRLSELERESYHGGLTHSYFIGHINKRVYKLDVNSLYPYVMLNRYPIRPRNHFNQMLPGDLRKACKSNGAVARVYIKSRDTPYPVYDGKRLIEATGLYETVLCGQELIDALKNNHVIKVYEAQTYELAPIFTNYVNYFYNERLKYKKKGDEIGSNFCKLMLNSLYGKFGQRGFQWVDLTYDTLNILYAQEGLTIPEEYEDENNLPTFGFGVNHWTPKNFPSPLKLRYVGKCLQVKITGGEHHESVPIIAAYVTSYARSYIRFLRNIAGRNTVYYTDTDSIFCNEMGYNRLVRAGYVDSRAIGKLKLEDAYNKITIYGPKDYCTPKQRTIKGIRKVDKPICTNCGNECGNLFRCVSCGIDNSTVDRFSQLHFEHIKSIMHPDREPGPYIKISKVVKQLKRTYEKGTISKSGWTEYPVLRP